MGTIKFGTDGWRAVIAEDFTFANVARVARAAAAHWRKIQPEGTKPIVVVGYDRRFLSNEFATLTAETMAASGFDVILCAEPAPTPAVSFAVKAAGAVGGVMITASHNPPMFNGFKLKAHYGGSADPVICQAVERELDAEPRARRAGEGKVEVRDLQAPHLAAVKRLVEFKLIARSRIRFAHDAMHGVGAGCFDALLKGTTCQVTTLNAEHNPLFGGVNPEPIAKNYTRSSAWLKKHPHDLCLVTDGDADRVGGMDGRGRPLSTHQLICLLLRHLAISRPGGSPASGAVPRRVVKALTTTSMVDKMCAAYGLELVETGVGFKYICAEMLKGDVLLGAEESGGIGFPGHIPERDGIAAGMMLLEMLAVERQPLNKLLAGLEKEFGPHRYARIDTHFPLEKRAALMDFCRAQPPDRLLRSPVEQVKTFDGVKYVARDGSWLMVRGSGTEPILRIYAEADSDAAAAKLLKLGVQLTRQV